MNPGYSDWSTLDIDGIGSGVSVPSVRLVDFLQKDGIPEVDVLKLDIEHVAFEVLLDTLEHGHHPCIICIELEPLTWPMRTNYSNMVSAIRDYGYLLGALDRFEFTFVSVGL